MINFFLRHCHCRWHCVLQMMMIVWTCLFLPSFLPLPPSPKRARSQPIRGRVEYMVTSPRITWVISNFFHRIRDRKQDLDLCQDIHPHIWQAPLKCFLQFRRHCSAPGCPPTPISSPLCPIFGRLPHLCYPGLPYLRPCVSDVDSRHPQTKGINKAAEGSFSDECSNFRDLEIICKRSSSKWADVPHQSN